MKLPETDVFDCDLVPVKWLWPGHLPRGKITLISGEPGVGKSRLITDFAARISGGLPWPDGQPPCEIGDVILCCAEDDCADTIFPRLQASGYGREHVHVIDPVVSEKGRVAATTFPRDLQVLHRLLNDCPNPVMVVLDPLAAYLGPAGEWGNDIQSRLAPLAHIARLNSIALVAVTHRDLRPRTRGSERRALAEASYLAASRVAWHLSIDDQDPDPDLSARRRWFTPLKNNIGPLPPPRAFRFHGKTIAWDNPSALPPPPAPPTDRDESVLAVEWLRNLLAAGPVPAAEVFDQARQHLFASGTIRRVARKIGVRSRSFERQGPWKWSLPTPQNELQVKDIPPTLGNSPENEPASSLT